MEKKRRVEWLGETDCNFCSVPIKRTLYDGKTTSGPWAVMCGVCYANNGVGLGTGLGQKYVLETETRAFVKVEG